MLTTDPPSKKNCWLRKKEVFFFIWSHHNVTANGNETRRVKYMYKKKNHVKTWISIHSFLSSVFRVVLESGSLVPMGSGTTVSATEGVSFYGCACIGNIYTYMFLLSLARVNFEVDISLARSVQLFLIFLRIYNDRDFIFFRNSNKTK